MKAWSEFYRDVLPEVTGCPEPSMNLALLRTAQQFFSRAHVWTVWLDNTTTIADATEYDIELEPGSELVKMKRATLDGRPIRLTTPDSLPDDWKTNSAGIDTCVFTTDNKTITLLPANAAGLILRVEATLKPSNTATGVEDSYFDQYVDIIAMGAKARLMQQQGMSFSNPVRGLDLERQFDDAVSSLAIRKFRAFSAALPRGQVRTF